MQDAPETLELVVDVADPLDLLVDLCRPTGVFLPCAGARRDDARIVLRVRIDAAVEALRVACVVVERAGSDVAAGVRARFPNANAHAVTLLRTFAPILAERPPTSPRQKVVRHAGDPSIARQLGALAHGRTIVVPTCGPVLPGERIALTVGDAWAQSVLMVPLLAMEHAADGDGYACRAKLCEDATGKVVQRFLERIARAITPRAAVAIA